MSIQRNLEEFYTSLEEACQRYGRSSDEIRVMAVSKTRSVEEIVEARECGLSLFGENRVEEAAEKFAELPETSYPLVLIGHLQSGKVKLLDKRFSALHSLDSLKLARKLSAQRERSGAPLEVLLQVNTSGEESKSGFRDQALFLDAAAEIADLPYLNLRGVMTMAPFVSDEKVVRSCFERCREWGEKMQSSPVLSMGMSSDFAWAVAEGSTMLRIGSTIFGAGS